MSKSQPIRPTPLVHRRAASRWRQLAAHRWRSRLDDLWLVLGLGLLLVLGSAWSYQQPLRYRLPIEQRHGLSVAGLGESEQSTRGWQRWTAPAAVVQLPGVGRAAFQLDLEFHNPVMDAPRTLTISDGEQPLAQLPLRPDWQRVSLTIPAQALAESSGDLLLVLRTEPPFKAGDRELGVALRTLQVQQLSPAAPPAAVQWSLALTLLLLAAPLRLLGAPPRWVGLGVGAMLLATLLLLAGSRIAVLLALPPLQQALILALLAQPLLAWWVRAQPALVRRWAIAVAAVALSVFVVRLAGLQHPQFVPIDHVLRVHQIQAIGRGGRAQVQAELSRQYEWGQDIAVPYSLLSYDLFVPLVDWLDRNQLLFAVEATTVALDASMLLLLWSIARRSGLSGRASWWTAALCAVLPVGYLYHHDGSYPTIIGLWITVVALWLLTQFAERPRWWLLALGTVSVALSILMYVTHLAFVPALLGLAVLSAWLLGTGEVRRRASEIALATGLGFGLALLGYYGAAIPELVTRTIPRYIELLGQQGSVGRDASLLPGPLLGSTWQQLWGHYRLIGIGLALVGCGLALQRRERWTTHLVVAYGIFLLLTATADLRFGLWNKHMYFALPGVCLATGPLLGAIGRRGRAGTLLTGALFALLVWTSVEAWLLRVIPYIWSLETL